MDNDTPQAIGEHKERIAELERENAQLKVERDVALNKVIWGFHEEEYPHYSDNALVPGSISELHEECDAKEFNVLIKMLKSCRARLARMKAGHRKSMDRVRHINTSLLEALKAASEHLDYCGYGDKWERECADSQGLPKKIEKALHLAGYKP